MTYIERTLTLVKRTLPRSYSVWFGGVRITMMAPSEVIMKEADAAAFDAAVAQDDAIIGPKLGAKL